VWHKIKLNISKLRRFVNKFLKSSFDNYYRIHIHMNVHTYETMHIVHVYACGGFKELTTQNSNIFSNTLTQNSNILSNTLAQNSNIFFEHSELKSALKRSPLPT
jgi:hypothetical protein